MTLKKYRAAVLAFCMALFLAGCRMQGEATGTEKDDLKGIDIEEKDGKEVYSFEDKAGMRRNCWLMFPDAPMIFLILRQIKKQAINITQMKKTECLPEWE